MQATKEQVETGCPAEVQSRGSGSQRKTYPCFSLCSLQTTNHGHAMGITASNVVITIVRECCSELLCCFLLDPGDSANGYTCPVVPKVQRWCTVVPSTENCSSGNRTSVSLAYFGRKYPWVKENREFADSFLQPNCSMLPKGAERHSLVLRKLSPKLSFTLVEYRRMSCFLKVFFFWGPQFPCFVVFRCNYSLDLQKKNLRDCAFLGTLVEDLRGLLCFVCVCSTFVCEFFTGILTTARGFCQKWPASFHCCAATKEKPGKTESFQTSLPGDDSVVHKWLLSRPQCTLHSLKCPLRCSQPLKAIGSWHWESLRGKSGQQISTLKWK